MFFGKQKQCDDCPTPKVDEVDYKRLSESLKKEVDQLQKRLNTAYTETGDADFVFNFNAVKVFSVERNWHNDRPCTIVGYIVDESGENGMKPSIKEWYLYCSKEQHAKLVEQFKKAMEK